MKWVMLAFSPIPGFAQFLTGRNARGFALVAAGIVGLNGVAVLGPGLRPESTGLVVATLSWIALIGAGGASVLDTVRHVVLLDRSKLARNKRRLLEKGIECYLRDDAEAAMLHFAESVNLDPQDADSRMYLATALRAQGNFAAARKHFKRAAALNSTKWSWEAAEELHALDGK